MSAFPLSRRDVTALGLITTLSVLGVVGCFSEHTTADNSAGAGTCTAPSVPAGTVLVYISNFTFSPATVHVKAGGTIAWVNCETGISHTSTADAGQWDTGTLGPGAAGIKSFATAGTFPYHCAIHPSMKATVITDP